MSMDDRSPPVPATATVSAHADAASVATGYAPETGRRLILSAVIFAVLLLAAFLSIRFLKASNGHELAMATKASQERRPPVDAITITDGSKSRSLTLPGETSAWYEATIYARVNGYVAKWYADIGDHVGKDQLLATIDTPDLDAELDAARAQLNAAYSQVKVCESEVEFAKTTNDRWRDSPKGVVSEQERQAKKADYESAVAKLNAAHAQVELNQAGVNRLLALFRYKRVTAPFDGTITERRIDVGNLVTAGSTSSTTPLYRMSQDDPMRVFVNVPQSAADDLMKVGIPVQVHTGSAQGKTFTGEIARSAKAIDPQSRTLRVEVDIANPDRILVPGMYVDATFDIPADNAVQVPAAALVFRSAGPQIAVIDSTGTVRFRKVVIARDDGNVVALGSGVAAGDRVALNISSQIVDGDKVAPVEPTDRAAAPPAGKR